MCEGKPDAFLLDAILTDDEELLGVLKSVRVHGGGSDKYDNVRIGINGRGRRRASIGMALDQAALAPLEAQVERGLERQRTHMARVDVAAQRREQFTAAVEAGKHQLSVGYHADLDETPGSWRGERYDAVQRNIRGNHLAIVDQGRAGPAAAIRIDTKEPVHMKIKIGSNEFEVDEAVGKVLQADIAALIAERDTAKTDATSAQERVAALEALVLQDVASPPPPATRPPASTASSTCWARTPRKTA